MSLLISLIILLVVAGAAYAIVRLLVGAFGLPPVIVQVAGILIAVVVVVYLLQLLPGLGHLGAFDAD